MEISVQGYKLEFVQVPMKFKEHGIVNLIAEMNNKTLAETLLGRRYSKLSGEVRRRHPSSLNDKLGVERCL